MIKHVIKRDGRRVLFDKEKIRRAITKASVAADARDDSKIKTATRKVVSYLNIFFNEYDAPDVEQIQDLVEKVLIEEDMGDVAKRYILYRDHKNKLRDTEQLFSDGVNAIDKYLDRLDWQVNENSNTGYSLQGMHQYIISEIVGEYWIQKIYPEDVKEAHRSGDLHLHDLAHLSVYCCGWDLEDLLEVGFSGVRIKTESKPPNHLRTALGQIVNFFYTLQGECYSADTEVLTEKGWKLFRDLEEDERVYTRNTDTAEIELQTPVDYMDYPYDGEMYRFKTEKVDLLVTPNHNMYTSRKDPFVKAKDMKPSHAIPKGGIWKGQRKEFFTLPETTITKNYHFSADRTKEVIESQEIPMDTWLAFFGFWTAEGSTVCTAKEKEGTKYQDRYVRITQSEGERADEFREVLEQLPFEYYEYINKNTHGTTTVAFTIWGKQLYDYLEPFSGSANKYIPKELKSLPPEQLQILLDWLMKGDGYIGGGNYQYYTKSKRLADDVQEIMLKLDYNSSVYKHTRDKFTWYKVSMSRTNFSRAVGKPENCDVVHYKGRVYCVEVPNHTLYVRRNGHATWCGNSAGAQALSNFDTYLAPFIARDNLSYKEVKQAMQSFLFNMNVPTRVGWQAPFTNITLDLKVPEFLANEPVIIGGERQSSTFGEYQEEVDMFNRAFAEVMMEGDAKGRMFSFPIPTYNITSDFDWDNPVLDPVWEMTAKYGIPYFANFVNSDMAPDDVRSMCCRLRIDNSELKKRGGGLFGANPMTGSIGVVTLNMARLGYLSKDEDEYIERVYRLMDVAKESLLIKRRLIEKLATQDLYPYTRFYLRSVKDRSGEYYANHFNTIGVNGMNEGCLNLFGETVGSDRGRAFTKKVMKAMRERLSKYQEETGQLFNLEATPAESTSYRLARKDRAKFDDIVVANNERVNNEGAEPYYTNSTQLPVGYTNDVFTALELQDEIQTLYTGGTVIHGFLGESINSIGTVKKLVKRIAHNFELPYYSITPTFSICPKHGYLSGEHEYCPKCEAEG